MPEKRKKYDRAFCEGAVRIAHETGKQIARELGQSVADNRLQKLSRVNEYTLHILFVCTGNICRSPIAERLSTTYSIAQGAPDLIATSAGTRAVIGHPVHPHAEQVLRDLGGNPAEFAARQLTGKIASNSDLILTMTREHRDAGLDLAPHRLNRTFTLIEASLLVTDLGAHTVADLANLRPHLEPDRTIDIADPIGQSPEVFAAVGRQIADLLPPIIDLCRG
ncbi:arsenate reductase/protein-tyrosine-phosphatase family protein [Mycobacterium sp. C31M]